MVTPIPWESVVDAEVLQYEQVYAENFVEYMQGYGDLFSREVHRIGDQRLPEFPRPILTAPDLSATHGHVITAAIAVLEDGKARTAEEIWEEALARKLIPPQTKRQYIYSALIEYIARWLGRGRKPQIVQDASRKFRINEPPDDWPDLVALPTRAPDAAADALIERLKTTSNGKDPDAFEIACCDAFAHLGFRSQHIGGHRNPDGYADAILGPLGYRVMLESKTSTHPPSVRGEKGKPHSHGGVIFRPDVPEAAKFVEKFGADYAVLIGPDFENEIETLNEAKQHKVVIFTVNDLATLLHLGADALEIRAILDEPGFAMEKIGDLVWERRHGRVKRVATVAALIQRAGWAAQVTAAEQRAPSVSPSEVEEPLPAPKNGHARSPEAPRLTVDAAMLLVDQALRDAGSTQACTREEVEAAFAHLTDPLVGAATWLDTSRTAIAILVPPDPLA